MILLFSELFPLRRAVFVPFLSASVRLWSLSSCSCANKTLLKLLFYFPAEIGRIINGVQGEKSRERGRDVSFIYPHASVLLVKGGGQWLDHPICCQCLHVSQLIFLTKSRIIFHSLRPLLPCPSLSLSFPLIYQPAH